MIVLNRKVRGFICTTAHPVGVPENVRRQIEYVRKEARTGGPKRVLVVGSSTGYGLASRIELAFSSGAATLGVMFERPASGKRTASAGWYNTAAFEEFAHADGLYAKTIRRRRFFTRSKGTGRGGDRGGYGAGGHGGIQPLAAPRRTLADGTKVSSVLQNDRRGLYEQEHRPRGAQNYGSDGHTRDRAGNRGHGEGDGRRGLEGLDLPAVRKGPARPGRGDARVFLPWAGAHAPDVYGRLDRPGKGAFVSDLAGNYAGVSGALRPISPSTRRWSRSRLRRSRSFRCISRSFTG